VTPFERLHPAVQHHVVNSLGWKTLRPLQEAAIDPILAGEHALLLAPTAGGKTEAAILPILSRMLSEDWLGLSVVYVCPIKALLNNLEERLSRYAGLLGRRVAVWHGDIPQGERAKTVREPPDVLLATPESLEVVLVSRRVDHRAFFKDVRVFIIDEIHAFAGDDRGWHLLGLLDRLSRLSGRTPQRLGLSATVGNAEALLDWLVAGRDGAKRVVAPETGAAADADVQIDFVGNLANAATVISRLHRGEKRLVFCDSRSQAEGLAVELRARNVRAFVSHSSLSADARRQAESAFASGDDCVIVATSTLELGIDVGDLDRVIQIDAPHTVASFLQRLGRTGRRPGTRRNCLFLATTDNALLRATALVNLWRTGFVEPIVPPSLPYHVLAQQLLALALQESGIGKQTWVEWIPGLLSTTGVSSQDIVTLVSYMLDEGILFEDEGVLGVGAEGEARYGLKNFLELFSVFSSPPLFTVLHGRSEIGKVHQLSFQVRDEGPSTLVLGGRRWMVKHIDWNRRQAFVEPSERPGRSRWLGTGQPLHFTLCQWVKATLAGDALPAFLSQRAKTCLEDLRRQFAWVTDGKTSFVTENARSRWWTFAGARVNSAFAVALQEAGTKVGFDDFALSLGETKAGREVIGRVLRRMPGSKYLVPPGGVERMAATMKFAGCVPPSLRAKMVSTRQTADADVRTIAGQRLNTVTLR
jgi:ATP-dependent Lhr-like helicase